MTYRKFTKSERRILQVLGQTLTYNLSRAFATFPLPATAPSESEGLEFLARRDALVRSTGVSLTRLYNRLHDAKDNEEALANLREALVEVDHSVLRAYGWNDIELSHKFHEVQYLPEDDRVRFSISESARVEVLRRLGELNRKRYEEEQSAAPAAKPRAAKGRPKAVPESQGSLALGEKGSVEAIAPAKKAPKRSGR